MDTGSTWITDCTFVDNEAGSTGGAVMLTGKSGYEMHRITGCIFWRNRTLQATGGGGALSWDRSGGVLRGNTFVECFADAVGSVLAIDQELTERLEMDHNVFAYNSGAPALFLGPSSEQPIAGCNLFWDNEEGNWYLYESDETDLFVDPRLCDLINGSEFTGDLSVADASPCLPSNSSCGELIGARGEGCTDLAVEATTWGAIKGMYRAPAAAYRGQTNSRSGRE
ncbi:MAG: hypothetical protein R3B81_01695 [bacterium]